MVLRMMPEAVRRVPEVVNYPHWISMCAVSTQFNMDWYIPNTERTGWCT